MKHAGKSKAKQSKVKVAPCFETDSYSSSRVVEGESVARLHHWHLARQGKVGRFVAMVLVFDGL